MRPSQKLGIDCRKSEPRRLAWSSTPLRWVAAMTPSGMGSTIASARAAKESCAVAGQKCSSTICMAGRRSRSDRPKSPSGADFRKSAYWR